MTDLIINNYTQTLKQYSYSMGSFTSVGHDGKDFIFHLCSDIDNDLKIVLENILQLDPHSLITSVIRIYERKIQKRELIFGQTKQPIHDDYYTTAMVDYYSDGPKLEYYNKIHRERFPLTNKKNIRVGLETSDSFIYDMNSGSSINNITAHCSKKVWNKAIAKYKLNI